MRIPLALLLFIALASSPATIAQPSAVIGDWAGTIEAGGGVDVVLHVTDTDGGLASTLDVPTQGATGVPTGETTFDGGTLTVTVPAVGARFRGTLDGDAIDGTWTQAGTDATLRLERLAEGEAAGPPRPQEPEGPVPYREEAVSVEAAPGVTLAGTLVVPEGDGPFPTVVLVSGSGPQNRDAVVAGHRVFLVWADLLARRGVASVRYDERGVGESTGDFAAATSADFAADAAAVADAVSARPEVGPVGVLGHSEGAMIAPLIAERSDAVAFVAGLAGPVRPFRETLRFQLLRDLPPADTARAQPLIGRALDAAAGGDAEATAAALGEAFGDVVPAERVRALAGFVAGPWGRFALGYDAEAALRGLRVPGLFAFGGRDQQVPAATNAPTATAALAESASPRYEVAVFADKNHLFQTAPTGAPAEYGQIEETVAPGVADRVADWVLDVAPSTAALPALPPVR